MWLSMTHLFLILSGLLVSVQSQNWTHHAVLDGNDKLHLYWNPPVDRRGNSTICFKVEFEGNGYIGLGFSPDGKMPGSDIVTGWIKGEEVYFQDRHAHAYDLPSRDDQQDYHLIDAYENDNYTVLIFFRKLDTCDKHDWVINDGTVRVIYAYSEEDPESDDPFYHGENRGSKSLILLQSVIGKDVNLDFTSLLQWEVRAPNITIPPAHTFYLCQIFKSPKLSQKHHIVYIKLLHQEGHEQFVHHSTVYGCVGGTPEEYEVLLDKSHECYQPGMPDEMFRCDDLYVDWGLGGNDIHLPEHVGIPIDPGPGNYYMLEIHYDNPQQINGIVDDTGFRFYYTPELRNYDAGKIGVTSVILPRVFIPPGQKRYLTAAHANPECFTSILPDSGVRAIAIAVHGHSTLKEVKVRHFRGDEELIPIYEDKHFDFQFQVQRHFQKEVTILPNDKMTTECAYDSTEKNRTTFFGFSTEDEMCSAIIFYYPRVKKTVSTSGPTFDTINKIFNTNVSSEAEVVSVFRNYEWDGVNITEVQNSFMYSQHETLCYYGPLPLVPVQSFASYPKNFIPYEPESTCNVTAK